MALSKWPFQCPRLLGWVKLEQNSFFPLVDFFYWRVPGLLPNHLQIPRRHSEWLQKVGSVYKNPKLFTKHTFSIEVSFFAKIAWRFLEQWPLLGQLKDSWVYSPICVRKMLGLPVERSEVIVLSLIEALVLEGMGFLVWKWKWRKEAGWFHFPCSWDLKRQLNQPWVESALKEATSPALCHAGSLHTSCLRPL